MTENEAIKSLELCKESRIFIPNNIVLDLAIQALEKQIPKKPIIIDRRFQNGDEVCVEWKCPVCGLNVIEEPPCQEYCQSCGNKLDWSEEEEGA